MLSINFICRESKADKKGFAPVEMSVIYAGKRAYINLPRKELPVNFRHLMSAKKSNDLKSFCFEAHRRIQACFSELYASGVDITPAVLKSAFKGEYRASYTVGQLCSEYLDILKKRVDANDLTLQVYFKYERVCNRLMDKVGVNSDVNDINKAVILSLVTDLKGEFEAATVSGYFTRLKTVVKYAMDLGKLKVNPFIGIKVSRGVKEVKLFSMEEYYSLRDKDFSYCVRLDKVRDLFIFSCNSG